MKKSLRLTGRTVSILLLAALCAVGVFADGTEELGTPSVTIASGTGVVASGTGLLTQPGMISLTVPVGVTVNQVLLYWEGQMTDNVAGDDTINVAGVAVTGTLIGGPTVFFSGGVSSAYRADITGLGLVGPGLNSLAIDGMDFTGANNGAGIMVIFEDPAGTASDIQIFDGLDLAFSGFAPPLQTTVKKEFNFEAASVDRTATLANFFSSVAGDASGSGNERPSVVEIRVLDASDGIVNSVDLINVLDSNDGEEWDTLITNVIIPAGAVKLTVQALSEDRNQTGNLPASMAWTGSGLSVPRNPDIDIRKEAEGPDIRTFVSGSDVGFTIVVENIGDVDLTDVVVTDAQVPGCAMDIGDLAAGDSTSYACVASNVIDSFENEACVEGMSDGIQVTDCDPSTVEIINIDIRKQAEGPDSRTFPSGSDVTFEIAVTNTGDEDLSNVQVTDAQAPGCALSIGDLAAGASVSYTCTVPNVTTRFDNEACVTGERKSVQVSDCDPSSVEIEVRNHGCTPGYWKNHLDSWPPTGYSPAQSVVSVFASAAAFPNLGSASLHDALNFGGGPRAEGAAKILLRAAVAALLNSAHSGVSYPRSPATIIADVNAALASGNRNAMLSLASMLDGLNNLGCPLN